MLLTDKPADGLPVLSTNAFNLFRQATRVESWCREDEVEGVEAAKHVLVFGREVTLPSGDKVWQIAIYEASEGGRVMDWRHRYQAVGDDYKATVWKMIYLIENDMLPFQHVENL